MGCDHQVLQELLAGNERHVTELPDGHFADVQEGQQPDVVSVCCSDSRVPQERMWDVEDPGTVFTPSNIGNQVWDEVDGDLIVNGGMSYPIAHTGTDAAAVVGHTGCGAVTAAYEAVTGGDMPGPQGVDKWVELLRPVVEDGLESDAIDADADDDAVINRLVEYNVDRQVEFLREAADVPDEVDVYGFVYDFQRVYGDENGRTYLVNLDGETDPDAITERLPDEYADAVRRLLS